MAWGPPMVERMIGMVMNGPMPIMFSMLADVAAGSLIARTRPAEFGSPDVVGLEVCTGASDSVRWNGCDGFCLFNAPHHSGSVRMIWRNCSNSGHPVEPG